MLHSGCVQNIRLAQTVAETTTIACYNVTGVRNVNMCKTLVEGLRCQYTGCSSQPSKLSLVISPLSLSLLFKNLLQSNKKNSYEI